MLLPRKEDRPSRYFHSHAIVLRPEIEQEEVFHRMVLDARNAMQDRVGTIPSQLDSRALSEI